MSGRSAGRRRGGRWARWMLRVAALTGASLFAYTSATFVQVWMASREDQVAPTDAIVALGAAQYDGTPSPVLQGRLDHALDLYEEGVARALIVTGGKQEGDRFTEAYSGYEYLREHGVPEEAIFLEVDGANTYEQLSASALILDEEGFRSAILVSSPYHSKRLLAIADEVGIPAARVSPAEGGTSLAGLLRETAAVSAGRIVGYRRLANWF